MTTEELIQWVDGAISVREDSYIPSDEDVPRKAGIQIGHYSLSESQALAATKPENAKDYEESIAFWLIGYGNDITDWMKEIEFNKSKEPTPMDRFNNFIDERIRMSIKCKPAYHLVKDFVIKTFK